MALSDERLSQLLALGALTAQDRASLGRAYVVAPWCWPREEARGREASERAATGDERGAGGGERPATGDERGASADEAESEVRRLAAALALDGPPPLVPGQALGVSVRSGPGPDRPGVGGPSPYIVKLWSFGGGQPAPTGPLGPRPRPEPASLAPRLVGAALAAWRRAEAVLADAVPVVWRSVRDAARDEPAASWLTATVDPALAGGEQTLDGPSFGLAFLFVLAGRVLETPTSPDVAGLACIEPDGALRAVEALDLKLGAIAALAPRVRRVIVSAAQHEVAREWVARAGLDLTVLAAPSAREALEAAFPSLVDGLVAGGAAARRERAEAVFRLALSPRTALRTWAPLAAAARALREVDPAREGGEAGGAGAGAGADLDGETTAKLRFAEAIARRHDDNRGELDPGPWIERLPRPVRLDLIAHVVQQAADAGSPSVEAATALVERWRAPRLEAFDGHLRLLGAWGRLLAVTGEPARALAAQREAAKGWLERWRPEELSHPLCEWIRLANLLGDDAARREAEDLADEVRRRAQLDEGGQAYVELARLRSEVERAVEAPLGAAAARGSAHRIEHAPPAADLDALLAALDRLAETPSAPPDVQVAALRWRARAAERSGRDEAAARARALLAARGGSGARGGSAAREALVLLRLASALDRADTGEAEAALATLGHRDVAPYPTAHLVEASRRLGEPAPAYVARWFPY